MKRLITLLLILTVPMLSCAVLDGAGTVNRLAKYSEKYAIVDSSITDNGTHLVFGTVYDDMTISMVNARIPQVNAPSFTSYKGSEVATFSATQTNTLYFSAQLPHGYKEGTDIEFHIHLAYPNANTGNSTWTLTQSWANHAETFPLETTHIAVVASPAVTDYHQLAEIATSINGTGKKISSVLLCSINRLGGDSRDNYGSSIYLVSADFHYQKDTLGSKTATSK